MPQELLFELGDVRVTPHIAQFGGTSYQIANIGSVRVVPLRRRNPVAVVMFLLGLGLLAVAIFGPYGDEPAEAKSVAALAGLGTMLAACLLQFVWPRRVFVLMLKTPSGDVEALASRQKKFVFDVKQAVEQAFIARSRAHIAMSHDHVDLARRF
jgi:Family of unknown function (DUF6232)